MRAAGIRFLAFALPLAFSVVVGSVVGTLLPAPSTNIGLVAWWAIVLISSTLAVIGADRLTRRLLPLATLMRLSMLFPDHAPSRVKLARRVAGSRAIAAELQRTAHAGMAEDRQVAAETILTLVGALGDYDTRTRGHSERTQLFVTMLAEELKLRDEDRGRLMWAALVHDIGKLKVPQEVLNKPARPTEDEWELLHSHPHQGALICEPLREWLGEWWPAIEQHHEKYDGSGYPHGLAGNDISYGARIVAVADSYEVMTASRPYKRPMTAEAARAELTRCAGTHFDPDIVRAFLNISLGRMRRSAGPLAWLMQVLLVRPGPVLGQILGASAGAAGAAATVLALNVSPSIAQDAPARHQAAPQATSVRHPDPTPRTQPPTSTPSAPDRSSRPPADPVAPTVVPQTPAVPSVPVSPSLTSPSPTPAPTTPSPEPPLPPPPTPPTTPPPTSPPPAAPPVLRDDSVSLAEDTPVSIDVLANDSPRTGGTLDIAGVSPPSHGSATKTGDGTVRYHPAADYNGPDRFSYTVRDGDGTVLSAHVTIAVEPVDDPPIARHDTQSLPEDSVAEPLALLDNDIDVDGGTLVVTSVTGALNGAVTRQPGGAYTYTPDPDFNGVETLTYAVSDGNGGTDSAGVTLQVTPVNDLPVAVNDAQSALEDSVDVPLALLGNDTDVDGDGLVVTSVTGALNGAVTQQPGGAYTYTPDPDFNGVDTLTYTVSDGNGGTDSAAVTLQVTPVNDPPVAVNDAQSALEDSVDVPLALVGNDTDVDGDGLVVTSVTGALNGAVTQQPGGAYTYTPDPDFNGVDTLTYTVSDGNGGTDSAAATVTIDPVNDPPVAGPDAFAITTGQVLSANAANGVLSNDSDVDGDPLLVTGDNNPAVDINPDGSILYTGVLPTTEVVLYTVSDGTVTVTGTLTITVSLLPPSITQLFLQPVDTYSTGALTSTPPVGAVSDWDLDGNPGLTIRSSDMKPTESDPTKYQIWSYPVPPSGMNFDGPITMDLWTSLKDQANKDLDYAAWVYDCNGVAGCSLLASTVNVHVNNWSTTTTWEKRTVTVGSSKTLVPAGHTIEVRLAFNHTDVWIPLDSAHPTSLNYTG